MAKEKNYVLRTSHHGQRKICAFQSQPPWPKKNSCTSEPATMAKEKIHIVRHGHQNEIPTCTE
jgi:hypothetical protein